MDSRTKNSIRNSSVVFFCKIISIIFSFAIRTIFINYLGKTILGIEGLFANIITILNLADLGLSTSIIFMMYKPIAENDERKISAILNYLNKFYFVIGFIVLSVGLAITPLLPHLINLENPIKNLNLYYILTIISTSMTYFFASRRSLFEANQKFYIVNIVDTIVTIVASILRLLILILTGSYAIYLIVTIITNLSSNLIIYIIGNKKYKYLKNYKSEKLNQGEKKELYKNMTAVMSHKVGSVLVTGTDNLLISVLLSTILVGIYSNYLMIINMIMGLVTIVISSLTPSVGNLKQESQDTNKDYNIYKLINFVTFWLVSVTAICLFCLLNPFIQTWLDSSFLFDWKIVLLLCANYYISTMRHSVGVFATAAGYFKKTWYKPFLEGLINLVCSILLARFIGVAGIFLGTTISLILGSCWIDPVITFKHWFKRSPLKYFLNYLYELIVLIAVGSLCYFATKYINLNINVWLNLILQGITCFAIANLGLLLVSFKKNEFKEIVKKVLKK